MGANGPLRSGQFGPQGHGWKNYCKRPPNIATYSGPLAVSLKNKGFL